MLTGDTLFVGDVARPDLAVEQGGGRARDLPLAARQAARAARRGRGVARRTSAARCAAGPGMDMKVSSTIGFERAPQPAAARGRRGRFVERALRRLGPQPPNFRRSSSSTAGRCGTARADGRRSAPRQVEQRAGDGRARRRRAHRRAVRRGAHPRLRLRHRAARRASAPSSPGWPTASRTIVLVGPRRRGRAARGRARRRGRRRARRRLPAGRDDELAAGAARGRAASSASTSPELHERAGATALQVLDVRERTEWGEGHIPGSLHVPYHDLHELPAGLDPARPVAVDLRVGPAQRRRRARCCSASGRGT